MRSFSVALRYAVAVLLVFTLALWLRAWSSARHSLSQARALYERKEFAEAFREYRSAIGWDAPFLATSKQAYLESLARVSDIPAELQLDALWHLRAGLFSSRSLAWDLGFHPFPLYLAELDARIAKLSNPEAKLQLQELYKPKADRRFQLLANLSFWGWLLSVATFIFLGCKADGSLNRTVAWRSAGAGVSFYVLWLCMLLRA